MIPRTIHYCWFGRRARSDLNRRCEDSWRSVLRGYAFKEWNESNAPLDAPYARAAQARGLWSKLANYVRLRALYEEGGLYFDTDVEVMRDFSPLLGEECFVGFQQKGEDADWVANGVIGARRGHPFLGACMRLTEEKFEEAGVFLRSPQVTTAVLKGWGLSEYGLQEVGGVKVYPAEYFYPFPWYETFSPDCVKENTYSVHHWEASWIKSRHPLSRARFWFLKRVARSRQRRSAASGRVRD
ncbi:MAG TPA: glycosyltransferase [Pyrinomonadaceae bacterium]|nr:glycosyltransferase [Pyrinomonadaceae bacterium]